MALHATEECHQPVHALSTTLHLISLRENKRRVSHRVLLLTCKYLTEAYRVGIFGGIGRLASSRVAHEHLLLQGGLQAGPLGSAVAHLLHHLPLLRRSRAILRFVLQNANLQTEFTTNHVNQKKNTIATHHRIQLTYRSTSSTQVLAVTTSSSRRAVRSYNPLLSELNLQSHPKRSSTSYRDRSSAHTRRWPSVPPPALDRSPQYTRRTPSCCRLACFSSNFSCREQ